MKIIGIGTDIVQKSRIRDILQAHKERFIARILSQEESKVLEQTSDPTSYIAKRFAAKEAIAKALGLGIGQFIAFNEISILNYENGKPYVQLHGKAIVLQSKREVLISIADEHEFAIAYALIQEID